jgi:hypothetical protein
MDKGPEGCQGDAFEADLYTSICSFAEAKWKAVMHRARLSRTAQGRLAKLRAAERCTPGR